MKKIFKGLFTTVLALGFLAGCKPSSSTSPEPSSETPVVKHLVEFYEDNVGKFYLEVEVEHNTKVAKPADPAARKDYDFDGWWTTAAYAERFSFDTLIVEDTTIYGKWIYNPQYVADERTFHVVGDMQNTELAYINWNAAGEEGVDWDVRSYLTKAEDSNLYSIEYEVGYLGKFKIKIPGRSWDSDTEFNYLSIREEDLKDYLKEADNKNIQVTTAGKYLIEVETTYNWARVTRLGDAVGEGVKQDPAPGSIQDWGLVGTISGWGGNPDISLTYDEGGEYYYLEIIHLPLDAEFKLRADNSWGIEWGSHVDNELEEDAFLQGTEVVEEVETIKEGANIKVLKGGYYSVFFDKEKLIIQEVGFALRGDALPGGWNADSDPLALVGEPVVDAEAGTIAYVYEGTYEMTDKEFKVKMRSFGDFANWDYASFGDGAGNFVVPTAGSYVVTLNVVLDVETLQFTGSASFVAAPAE